MDEKFMAGAARAVITPPIGAWMAGYAPARRAETIHDDLHVTAIAFAGSGRRALLISADVCQIFEPHIGSFRRSIADATGVPYEQIVMSAIHTHSGPATFGTHGGAPADEVYLETIFRPQAVKAAEGSRCRSAAGGYGRGGKHIARLGSIGARCARTDLSPSARIPGVYMTRS